MCAMNSLFDNNYFMWLFNISYNTRVNSVKVRTILQDQDQDQEQDQEQGA